MVRTCTNRKVTHTLVLLKKHGSSLVLLTLILLRDGLGLHEARQSYIRIKGDQSLIRHSYLRYVTTINLADVL